MTKNEAPGLADAGATNGAGKADWLALECSQVLNGSQATTLECALEYAAHGIPVFPCGVDKRPLTPHGFKDAITDPETIRQWWAQYPAAMIGMPTGPASDVFVIDVDRHGQVDGEASLKALEAQFGPLPSTKSHATPSDGRHLIFQYPVGREVRNTASKIGPGLDVRGEGGYVILPPSVNSAGTPYSVLDASLPMPSPEWLLDSVSSPPKAEHRPTPQPRHYHGGNLHPYVRAAVDGELQAVAAAPEGTRNNRLNQAAFSLAQWVASGELLESEAWAMLEQAAARCGLEGDEVRRTVESGFPAGMKEPRQVPTQALAAKKGPLLAKKAAKTTTTHGLDRHGAQRSDGENNDMKTDTSQVIDDRIGNCTGPFDTFDEQFVSPSGPTLHLEGEVNEESIAMAFADEYKDILRYCKELGVWLEWSEERCIWVVDRKSQAFNYIRRVCKVLNPGGRTALSLGRASTANGVEKFARADPYFATVSEDWDSNPMLLGMPGSSLTRKEDYITKTTAVAPAPGLPGLWLSFLNQATNGDKELQRFLQQICGYCLTGYTREHAFFFIYGAGDNGKSVFLNTISKIMGDYAKTAAMDTFTASKNDRHPTDLAMLRGARLVTATETEEGRAWAESKIKLLTGGDPIAARFMRQDFFTYTPQFKIVVIGNHKPRLRNVDDAMRRRINIIPFIHKPENPDQHLEEKLKAEYPQILQWMIDGREDWLQNGLIRPDVVKQATDEYFEVQDLFKQWIEENCETGKGKSAASSALYSNWKGYAEGAGEIAGNRVQFSDNMDKRGFKKNRASSGQIYKGIALRAKGDDERLPYCDN